ncbi:MAG: MBL fold metallo-hydrolase [Caulobacterales bacterium]|jgi:glyoxylase-like metal-dependent hydrolase (beta-lactamase superfamily II)
MNDGKPIQIVVIPVTSFQQNTSLVWCTATRKGAFVDPGGEIPRLIAAAQAKGVTIEKIMLTHGHLDHAGAAADLAAHYGVPIEGPHKEEAWLLAGLGDQGARYGLTDAKPCVPDRWLEDGDVVELGEARFDVHHCPGHTPGHVVFYEPTARFAFVGDVLFKGSIGRTDFPRGDFDALVSSIRSKLFPLGDDVRFLPGHGDLSTFGWERKTNPFVSDFAVGTS